VGSALQASPSFCDLCRSLNSQAKWINPCGIEKMSDFKGNKQALSNTKEDERQAIADQAGRIQLNLNDL